MGGRIQNGDTDRAKMVDRRRKANVSAGPLVGLAVILSLPVVYFLTGISEKPPVEDQLPVADQLPVEAALKIEMVELKGGGFLMGSDEFGSDNERPIHRVEIKPFAIGKYEVLGFQYKAFEVATDRSGAAYHGDKAPVSMISWDDAQAYIRWLNGRTGLNYRLLTEAEWEYAARAGRRAVHYLGDHLDLLSRHVDYGREPNGHITAGSFDPNAWGIYDMLGNVWEWVEDCWHGSYTGAPSDGSAWVSGCADADRAVVRGGSWSPATGSLLSANRTGLDRSSGLSLNGFRLARDL